MLRKAQRRQRARLRQQPQHAAQERRGTRTAAGGHHPKLSGLQAQRSVNSGGNASARMICVHQNYGSITCMCQPRSQPRSAIPNSTSKKAFSRGSRGPRSKSAKNRSQLGQSQMHNIIFQGSDQGGDQERVYMIQQDTERRSSAVGQAITAIPTSTHKMARWKERAGRISSAPKPSTSGQASAPLVNYTDSAEDDGDGDTSAAAANEARNEAAEVLASLTPAPATEISRQPSDGPPPSTNRLPATVAIPVPPDPKPQQQPLQLQPLEPSSTRRVLRQRLLGRCLSMCLVTEDSSGSSCRGCLG